MSFYFCTFPTQSILYTAATVMLLKLKPPPGAPTCLLRKCPNPYNSPEAPPGSVHPSPAQSVPHPTPPTFEALSFCWTCQAFPPQGLCMSGLLLRDPRGPLPHLHVPKATLAQRPLEGGTCFLNNPLKAEVTPSNPPTARPPLTPNRKKSPVYP